MAVATASRRWCGSVRGALQPSSAAWAVRPAIWAVVAAGVILAFGLITDHLVAVGLTYFGVACAAVFVTTGVYRTRVVALGCQAAGAVIGLGLGSLAAGTTTDTGDKILLAAGVALVSGMVGAIGRLATAGALMAVVGVAFAEFAGVALPWWQQAGYYLFGTATVFVVATAPWLLRREHHERDAAADVFDAAAELLAAIGTTEAAQARTGLARASAASRAASYDHRLSAEFATRAVRHSLNRAIFTAERVALAAAELYAVGVTVPTNAISAVRRAGVEVRANRFAAKGESNAQVMPHSMPQSFANQDETPTTTENPAALAALSTLAAALDEMDSEALDAGIYEGPAPLPVRLRTAARSVTDRAAVLAGLRLALCMSIATAVTAELHHQTHSFWLPMTVAVVVRPEYASVFQRIVNRVAGTMAGAVLAAAVLLIVRSGWLVAIAAALALGFAVLAAPRLYAFSVVGVTCSALLSACIGRADPAYPAVRALDTLAGCAIAVVFGYLLWPDRGLLPEGARLDNAVRATLAYLRQAVLEPRDRDGWATVRAEAYRSAHQARAAAAAALVEPPPVDERAAATLPAAIALEDLVDAIGVLAVQIESGAQQPSGRDVDALARAIAGLAVAPDPHPDGADPEGVRSAPPNAQSDSAGADPTSAWVRILLRQVDQARTPQPGAER